MVTTLAVGANICHITSNIRDRRLYPQILESSPKRECKKVTTLHDWWVISSSPTFSLKKGPRCWQMPKKWSFQHLGTF
jgi:hypothetical protein